MDDRPARRLGLVKRADSHTSSGIVTAVDDSGLIATPASVSPGSLIDNKYLIGRIIGAGAVGIVFEAKNVELDETVAIKCLKPEMLADRVMVARFAREAKAAAAIKSEYVATVHDVGTTVDGVPYIVMEYLEGQDLGNILGDTGPLASRAAVEYALQVCEALAVAHSKGIVHRDIKPENLLLTERAGGMRIVKVLDFGISKTALTGSIFQQEVPLVKTVNLMGTPLYMSPEQIRATDSVDIRSDIWSLGMVIYEMLTGQTAFAGQSITEICASILEATPAPIDAHRADVPRGLVDVIMKSLRKDAGERYQNVAELALALMPYGPKRSRLNVERAVAVLQGSGLIGDDVRVHSTFPPPTPSGSDLPSSAIPRPANVPSMSAVPASAHSGSDLASATTTVDVPRKSKGGVLVVAALAILLVGGALAFFALRSSTTLLDTTTTAQTSTGEATTTTTAAPTTAAPTTATAEATTAAPTTAPTDDRPTAVTPPTTATVATTTAARAPTTWRPPRTTHAPPAAKSPAAAPSASAAPRVRRPEEPDLGY